MSQNTSKVRNDANQSMCDQFQYSLETNFKEKQQIMLSFAWPHRSFCSGSFLISSHASSSSSCTSCSDSDSLGIPCEEILRSKISRPAICFPCFEQVRTVETELILGFGGDFDSKDIHQGKSRWHSYHVLVYISPVLIYILRTVPCTLTMGYYM